MEIFLREFYKLDNYDVENFRNTCYKIEKTYDGLKKFGNPFY